MKPIYFGLYADLQNIRGHALIEQRGLADVDHVEQVTGHYFDSVMWYPTWDNSQSKGNFPLLAADMVASAGKVPHLVWELCLPGENPQQSSIHPRDVADGKYDDYLNRYAAQVARWGRPLFIRFMHEFNGTWYSWSGARLNRDTELYKAVWRHVVAIFRKNGAHQVQWVWSPNVVGGGTPDYHGWNGLDKYWPGSEFVDWIGIDGYNFYPYFEGPQPLCSFEALFRETYEACTALDATVPLMIAEYATGEYVADQHPASKAEWIRDMFSTLTRSFERIEMLFWFHVNKELDWRIDSSDAALQAYREGLRVITSSRPATGSLVERLSKPISGR